jgi:cytoskeletal protein CcmA (bactofilin family)
MFGKKSTDAGITLIAENCEMVGDLHFKDQLLINGCVKGNIYAEPGSKAQVTVSEKGTVRGDINVPNVVVNGKVIGDIRSDKHVELSANAQIKGNVYYSLVEMVEGSRIDGSLVHLDPEDTALKKPIAEQNSAATVQVVQQRGTSDKSSTITPAISAPPIAGGVRT